MGRYQEVPAAERALRLLEVLAQRPEGYTAQELARRLQIPRSGVYALLATLIRMGYVEQAFPRGPYRLGPRVAWLARGVRGPQSLVEAFHDLIPGRFDETVTLMVLDGEHVVVLAEAQGREGVRVVVPPGTRKPAQDSAGGWILLAHQGDPALDEVRRKAAALRKTSDVVELAVPLCADGHRPDAALVLHVPTYRWREALQDTWLGHLRLLAAQISHRLGAPVYRPFAEVSRPLPGSILPLQGEALQAFLQGPWGARLACLRPDGSPHVVPVWYEWHQGAFTVVAWPGSRWADFVRRNPHVALTVDEPWPPLRRVVAWGEAEPLALDQQAREAFRRISARYLGREVSLPHAATGWRAFRIVPKRLVGQQSGDG